MDPASYYQSKEVALGYVLEVKASGDGKTYQDFGRALTQFRYRMIDSKTTVATIIKLFGGNNNNDGAANVDHVHHQLLRCFNTFVPTNYSPPEEETPLVTGPTNTSNATPEMKSTCCDFFNRVNNRFKGNSGVYRKFLGYMACYHQKELTVAEAFGKIVELFGGENEDLTEELRSFMPDCYLNEISEASAIQNKNESPIVRQGTRVRVQEKRPAGNKRRRVRVTEYDAEQQRVKSQKLWEREWKEGNEMEDLVEEVEMELGWVRSALYSAGQIMCCLQRNIDDPVNVKEYFGPAPLAYLREKLKFTEERISQDTLAVLLELIGRLNERKAALDESRDKAFRKWKKIHDSCLLRRRGS